ncbi:hypothetical protein QCD83_23885 [Pseudomonas savastanoi pv. phaseolicola]|uniref:Uncharacterized protein n=1 Tax=Pseudomonas savastanoi pv. glycinea TaxID=318 RepID=A0A3M4NNZ2_PSESG|nr:hypothetical protein [Pseudomonas savastanoi]MDG6381873.1 hypothetical protein [Pseudomonas savastanoi pv. phaseolicola]RMM61878.1 hypothetical protein ALQ73_200307 [Pseudomonas savastanoi pv. glycinea]RMQ67686.1 hypothetical protein ALQ01_200086 [Pseudomonas savastanoi pv. glycinea]
MALVRLAKLEDYELFEHFGRTMYRITWCDKLCPGNPTDSPADGVLLFNEWQCAVASGNDDTSDPLTKLQRMITWCMDTNTNASRRLASDIVEKYKRPESHISLEFNTGEYCETSLAYRYELAFLHNQVSKLPALRVLQLQTSMQVAIDE